MKRGIVKLMIAGAALVSVTAAGRGGWAVITVDDMPEHLIVGKATDYTFKIRQHGVDKMTDRNPTLVLSSGRTSATIPARYTRAADGYTARVSPPTVGEWTVTIDPDFNGLKTELLPIIAVAANAPAPAPLPVSQRGKHLFVAKGCVGCHQHAAVASKMTVGPDLTGKRFAVDYLKQFLADPSIKPPTNPNNRMPKMDLKPAEIAALVAFLNESKVAASK